jgi:hypothetical protein
MEGNEVVGTCSTRAGNGKCIQTFGLKIMEENSPWDTHV